MTLENGHEPGLQADDLAQAPIARPATPPAWARLAAALYVWATELRGRLAALRERLAARR